MIYTKVFECEKEEDTKRLAQKFANIAKKGERLWQQLMNFVDKRMGILGQLL